MMLDSNRLDPTGLRPPTEVLIVGAGPVGLALALGLRQHGVAVRLIDRAPGPKDEPRAAVIWPRGAEALRDLGVGEAARDAANELGTVHFASRGRPLGAARLGECLESAFPRPLLIEQHVTERILAARLEALGVWVEWGAEATRLRAGDDGVEVLIRRNDASERIRCAWAVGCDGAHSFVRAQLGVAFAGGPALDLQLLQVDAVPRWRHPCEEDTGFYFLAPRACLGCFPIADGAYRFFCYTDDPDPARMEPPTVAEMEALIARVAGAPEVRLERPTWLNRARFQTRLAARLRVGRVLLAGDAAHVWPSLGGHGMNVGLCGAHNLAWKLAAVLQGRADDALLDTYATEEMRTVRRFLRLMRFNWIEQPGSRPGLLAREALLRVGLRLPAVSRMIERAVSDLDASHQGSTLASPGAGGTLLGVRLRAGDRVPDLSVRTPDAGLGRLHDRLSYRRWTLLVPSGLPQGTRHALQAVVRPRRDGVGWVEVAPASPDAAGAAFCILVRPDGHVGFVAAADDRAGLRAYLDRWCRAADRPDAEITERPVAVPLRV